VKREHVYGIIAWVLSILASLPAIGFLGNLYPSWVGTLLLTLFLQLWFASFFTLMVKKGDQVRSSQPLEFVLFLSLFGGLLLFALKMFGMLSQFPQLFDASYVLLENGQLVPFIASSLLSLSLLMWAAGYVKELHQSRVGSFLAENGAGLLLASVFFALYLPMALTFNQPAYDVDDIFFDTDGLLWRTRFTTDMVQDYYQRSVHPFVLLLIRPMVTLVSFLMRGDKLASAYVMTAFAGALCVFLACTFVKQKTGSSLYAALIAALLGTSAAHLVFGSLLETYIFLAVLAIAFMVFLIKDRPFLVLVLTGLISFGITLSNLIPMAIAFIFVKRDFKGWVKYGLIVGMLGILLTLLNNVVYPNSQPYFFNPSTLTAEEGNTFSPTVARGLAVARVMFLHSIVAPDPLILEEEIPFLKVWIFKADPMRLSEYQTGFGTLLAVTWTGLCLLGGFLFLKNFKRQDQRFPLALLTILLFNFLLHMRYGKDLFLYSTNWTYALVLFLSIQWNELSAKRWFQIFLLSFIFLLLLNNFRLIQTMLATSAQHIK
jgi:hypothetical protein